MSEWLKEEASKSSGIAPHGFESHRAQVLCATKHTFHWFLIYIKGRVSEWLKEWDLKSYGRLDRVGSIPTAPNLFKAF